IDVLEMGGPNVRAELTASARIDKSALTIGEPRRWRDKQHLRFVASRPCLVCGRRPSDAHHLRFAQLRAIGRKVSDEFTVPVCRLHHRALHCASNETQWWKEAGVDALAVAQELWRQSRERQHPLSLSSQAAGPSPGPHP